MLCYAGLSVEHESTGALTVILHELLDIVSINNHLHQMMIHGDPFYSDYWQQFIPNSQTKGVSE